MNWFRWHHGTTNDPKLRHIAAKVGEPVAHVIAVWAVVLESASTNAERGVIGSWSTEDVAFFLEIAEETVEKILAAMQGKVLDGQRLTGWDLRQPKREDDSTERVRAYREKRDGRETMRNAVKRDVTHGNAVKRSETPRGEERREEKKTTKDSSSPKAPKPDKKYPHYPIEYCDQLYAVYKTNRGPMEYGTFRKLSAPLFPTNYALDQIIHAMEAWLEYVEGIGPLNAKWEKLPEFCGSLERWVRIGAMTLADENGVTERGRLCCGIAA